jgi:hypothetical protein
MAIITKNNIKNIPPHEIPLDFFLQRCDEYTVELNIVLIMIKKITLQNKLIKSIFHFISTITY